MSDIIKSVTDICDILGVEYDVSSFSDECLLLEYLLNQIYYFIGGQKDA